MTGFAGNRPMGVGAYARRQEKKNAERERAAKGNGGGIRKKYVYSEDMVAHIWANQTQDSAKNARGNFYFSGTTIYSYGSHFPIATIVERKGNKCVLFTTRSYSSTTSGHIHLVRGSLRGQDMSVFEVDDNVEYGKKAVKEECAAYQKRIVDLATVCKRARSNKAWQLNKLECLVAEANGYANFFGSKRKFKVPTDFDVAKELERAKKEAAKENAATKERKRLEEIQLAENKAVHAAALDRWVAGEDVPRHHFHHADDYENTRLRIKTRMNGTKIEHIVETSRGAECPLKHALRILSLIRAGKEYRRNGHTEHLGEFAVDVIDVEGNLYAGCHRVKRAEIERIAAQVVAELPPINCDD